MSTFLLRRLLSTVPVMIGVTFLVFMMIHLIPGDPVKAMFRDVDNVQDIPEETVMAIRERLGLDQPLHIQYLRFLSRAIRGDLGQSLSHQKTVGELIRGAIPFTIELALASLLISVTLGVGLGIVSALKQGGWIDTISMIIATAGISIPNFWFGLMAILLFAVHLRWLPTSGQGEFVYLIMPAFTLGTSSAGVLARLTRSSLMETLGEDYIRTALSKGLSEAIITWTHALRNALIPVVTVIGIRFGALLGGAVVTEAVFARRGIGTLTITAITGRDFPLAQGIVLVAAISYVTMNLVVDVLYGVIDPRISTGRD